MRYAGVTPVQAGRTSTPGAPGTRYCFDVSTAVQYGNKPCDANASPCCASNLTAPPFVSEINIFPSECSRSRTARGAVKAAPTFGMR